MKYLYFFLFVLAISSCNRAKYVEFDGNIKGVGSGAFVIKDQQGNQLISTMISDGKFHSKNLLPSPGFYDLFITPDIEKDNEKKLYEVYLEDGNYILTADKDKLFLYPTIKSDAKIQNELSAYYSSTLQQLYYMSRQRDSINDMLYGNNTPIIVKSPDYYNLKKQLADLAENANNVQDKTLGDYISKNPDNGIEAFLLSQIDYKKQPKDYLLIYQKFNDEQKNTPEGKEEGDDLKQLTK
jgi:hypothetical protein